jgi:hypothetical protein
VTAERLAQLKAQYAELLLQDAPRSRDLAQLEHEIWDAVRLVDGNAAADGRKINLREWFVSYFKGNASAYETRGAVLRAGEWAGVLFERIDDQTLTLSGVRRCLRATKALVGKEKVPPARALAAVLDAFDGTADSLNGVTALRPGAGSPAGITASKGFKARTLQAASDFASHSMEGHEIEPMKRQQIVEEFQASLGRAVDDLLLDISRTKGDARKAAIDTIGPRRFAHACEVLGVSARFGKPLNARTVRQAYRRRASALQRTVDVATGCNDTSKAAQAAHAELQAVNGAHDLLRAYAKQRS